MKVTVSWEFEVDISDFDPKFVDVPGLAVELTQQELDYLLTHGKLSVDDFNYEVSGGGEEK